MTEARDITGPVLVLDAVRDGRLHLAALFVAPKGRRLGPVETEEGDVEPIVLSRYAAAEVSRARFTLPADQTSSYRWEGTRYEVTGDLTGDLRIAYVSCNGEEEGDLERDFAERDAMWIKLRDEHRRAPFSLLLHGGDQVYADEATKGHPLSDDWPRRVPPDPPEVELADLRTHLRERFLERYAATYRAEGFRWIAARVPSLMQWDDHDICDGWGSLQRSRNVSSVARTLHEVARESFLTFQQATTEGDLPQRFADPEGAHLGWTVRAPGLRILAPDLRSQRTRHQVMDEDGWAMMEAEAERRCEGKTLLMSSVPLLGPRLSLLEALMALIPQMQKYEDDLRDQWQSRAHRGAWRRMLRLVIRMAREDGHDVVALSGEIHLATRATMRVDEGRHLHQLVASGIAHRAPPSLWARALGLLGALGEAPLEDHPIRIERIPGTASRYRAERNYLVLERRGGDWTAEWELERSGRSEPLPL